MRSPVTAMKSGFCSRMCRTSVVSPSPSSVCWRFSFQLIKPISRLLSRSLARTGGKGARCTSDIWARVIIAEPNATGDAA